MDTAGLAGNNGHCHVLGTLQCKLSPLEKWADKSENEQKKSRLCSKHQYCPTSRSTIIMLTFFRLDNFANWLISVTAV